MEPPDELREELPSEPPPKQRKVGYHGGVWYCEHGRVPSRCRECQNEVKCVHDMTFYMCRECNVHGEGHFCFHDKRRSQCKECGGREICRHDRKRYKCKECGGKGICPHGRVRYDCKECGGGRICPHGRVRYDCKECGGGRICPHGRRRYKCLPCGGTTALKAEAKKEAKKEFVERWVRDSHLREKMLPTVAGEQGNKCAGFWTCEEVEDGEAVNRCPWGDRPVPKAAQQLDHIKQYAETQDDSRENLQMLCACCHAMKTAAERGAKSIGTTVDFK